jgi:RNA polymerase sigma-70 factor (ECF subfamily)
MEAFRLLYLKYYQKVFSTCLLILKNSALAEEATQEAFLKAYTNLHTLREPEKFGAWVAAIGSKQAINMYNRNKKSLTIGEEEKILHIKNIWGEQWDDYEPCQKYLEKETNQEIRRAIYLLDPLLSQMVILKYYWSLTDQEIADYLQVPLGTVKSSLFRARKTLEITLQKIYGDYLSCKEENGDR